MKQRIECLMTGRKVVLACALVTGVFQAAVAATDVTGLLVGRLATTERIIELWRVGDDTRYRVKTLDGEALSALLTETALEAEYPGLYKMVEQGVADDASLSPGMIDARHYEKRTPVPKQDFD